MSSKDLTSKGQTKEWFSRLDRPQNAITTQFIDVRTMSWKAVFFGI